jgi:hypothetical protein
MSIISRLYRLIKVWFSWMNKPPRLIEIKPPTNEDLMLDALEADIVNNPMDWECSSGAFMRKGKTEIYFSIESYGDSLKVNDVDCSYKHKGLLKACDEFVKNKSMRNVVKSLEKKEKQIDRK